MDGKINCFKTDIRTHVNAHMYRLVLCKVIGVFGQQIGVGMLTPTYNSFAVYCQIFSSNLTDM